MKKTKHIELNRNYINDNLDGDIIRVLYIKSIGQFVDIMTYSITGSPYHTSLFRLDMYDIYTLT